MSGTTDSAKEKVDSCSTDSAFSPNERMLQLVVMVGKYPLLLMVVYSGVETSLRRTVPTGEETDKVRQKCPLSGSAD